MSMSETRKQIAIVMPRLSRYGGAEGFAWRFSNALARAGYGVDFICSRVETQPPQGVNPIPVGRFGGMRFIKVLWFAWAADRVCRKNGYDLVVGLGNTVNQDILRIGGCPIKTFNELSIRAWPTGAARLFKKLRRCLSPAGWAIAHIDKLRMSRTNTIVAVSHFVRDHIISQYPQLDEGSIRVIYNRPDLDCYSPANEGERERLRAQAGVGPKDILITTAGTNFMLKGIRSLLKSLALLPRQYKLHVAGGRNPRSYLRLAAQLGVSDRVRFLGKVDDMPSFYRSSDIFILASYFDACSNAVLEALACGNKVLSSAMNGSAYFLPAEWVFPDPADHEVIAEKIMAVSEAPSPEPFTWPSSVDSGLDPYVDLVEAHLQGTVG